MDQRVAGILDEAARGTGRIVVLTGAGISAESGIPTFRGKEGYWTVGSREYHPKELATRQAFDRLPVDVWLWYLYRRGVCRAAEPNAGHRALVSLEAALGERFRLVTQNVDGLHLRSGNTLERTYQVHGNVDFMRCASECGAPIARIPDGVPAKKKGDRLTDAERRALHCRSCGAWMRPHVLWFDECYDEPNFRFESSLRAAAEADLLLVVGTSGETNLPMQVALEAARRKIAIVDVNPDDNPFARIAAGVPRGAAIQGRAGEVLPGLAERLAGGGR